VPTYSITFIRTWETESRVVLTAASPRIIRNPCLLSFLPFLTIFPYSFQHSCPLFWKLTISSSSVSLSSGSIISCFVPSVHQTSELVIVSSGLLCSSSFCAVVKCVVNVLSAFFDGSRSWSLAVSGISLESDILSVSSVLISSFLLWFALENVSELFRFRSAVFIDRCDWKYLISSFPGFRTPW